jgi:hypothetical protein
MAMQKQHRARRKGETEEFRDAGILALPQEKPHSRRRSDFAPRFFDRGPKYCATVGKELL